MVSLLPLHSDLLGKSQVPGPQPGFSIFTPYSPLSWKLCFKICVCLFSNSNCHEFFCILRGKMGFPGGSDSKQSTCNAGDLGSIPGLGRSSGEGKGYPLQYSGLENSMDSICIVHGVAKSRTRLSDFHFRIAGGLD